MTPTTWVLVAAAGATGALLRHEVTFRSGRPLRALHACNVLGALALGVLVGLGAAGPVAVAVGAGGLGAFTSFSTWVLGARRADPVTDLVVPLVLAVAAAALGTVLGQLLGGGA